MSAKKRIGSTVAWTWQLAARAVGFAIFMLGAFLSVMAVKWFVLPFQPSSESRTLWVRRRIQAFFQWQLRFFTALGSMNAPRFEGLENLPADRPCIIAANHPTLIDILLLGSCRANWFCIVKRSLWHHIFLRGAVRLAGYVPNDQGSKTLRGCESALRNGASLIVFPEGKRSPRGGLHPFTHGAVYLALRTRVPIVPAVIQCNMITLTREQKWYQVPDEKLEMVIRFHKPVSFSSEPAQACSLPATARQITGNLEAWFYLKLFPQRYGQADSPAGADLPAYEGRMNF